MFLEVKILKDFDPIWGFHPNFFSKIHQFLVITLIDNTSWSVHWPQGVYMRLITKNCELLKLDLG